MHDTSRRQFANQLFGVAGATLVSTKDSSSYSIR